MSAYDHLRESLQLEMRAPTWGDMVLDAVVAWKRKTRMKATVYWDKLNKRPYIDDIQDEEALESLKKYLKTKHIAAVRIGKYLALSVILDTKPK